MSDPTKRLLDLWLPPEDAGDAVGCLATTFTFDPDFFEEQCVARFLGLQMRKGEGDGFDDIGAVLEREERLAEVPVCVVADRGLDPDTRSLRWDLLAATCSTGVMHAKVSILHWRNVVRVVVSSANLTEHAFRNSIELGMALDFSSEGDLSRTLAIDLLEALDVIVGQTPPDLGPVGPRRRAEGILRRAREGLDELGLRERPRRGAPRLAVVRPRRGKDALAGLLEVWKGSGPPLQASVMSPFFDTGEGPGAMRATRRLVEALSTRNASIRFVVPVDARDERLLVRMSDVVAEALPARIEREILEVRQPVPAEPRGLHGKLILLERPDWVAALIGSSNFTAPGLWAGGAGNTEVGIAIGAPRDSRAGKALRALVLAGDPVPDGVAFEARDDPEESATSLPFGFVQAGVDPGPPIVLWMQLHPPGLPYSWRIELADGTLILDSDTWRERDSLETLELPLAGSGLPRHLVVRSYDKDGNGQPAAMPVNILDPSKLPPPEELRSLPLDALIRALADLRPLPEAVAAALRRAATAGESPDGEVHDPLKRFAGSGRLLHRARELSHALDAQRDRLERPVQTPEAYHWRVLGPFGPVEVARRLVTERSESALSGELAFVIAETALTLSRVDTTAATSLRPELEATCRAYIQDGIEALNEMQAQLSEQAPAGVAEYVQAALMQAQG